MSYASIHALSGTLNAVITEGVSELQQVRMCSITNSDAALKSVVDIARTPAVVIAIGPQTFDIRRIFKLVAVKILLVANYESIPGSQTLQALAIADKIESLFTPIQFPEEQVTYNGIIFIPEGIEPVEIDKCSRAVYLIELTAKLPITLTKE